MQQFPQGKIHQERGFIFQETRWLPYLKEDTALRGGGRGHKSLGSPSPSTGFGHHNPRAKSSPPSAFVNKALLSISICFHIMYNFFCNVTIELSSCPRVPIATQSLKYLLSSVLQKNFVNPYPESNCTSHSPNMPHTFLFRKRKPFYCLMDIWVGSNTLIFAQSCFYEFSCTCLLIYKHDSFSRVYI